MRVAEIFNRAQTGNIEGSRKALEDLRDLVSGEDTVEIFREFCECVSIVIGCKRKDVPKSIIQFVNELMKCLKHTRNGRNFIHNLIKYLVRGVDSKHRYTRINSLVILRGTIEHLDNVSERLWNLVKIKIGEKLFDKEVMVRIHAVHIVTKYQETNLDRNIPFYKLLKDLVKYDSSPEVRKTALLMAVVNKSTVPAIITRAADENEGVRMAFVCCKLSAIPWDELTQAQRHFLLKTLEEERAEEIRTKFLQKFDAIFEDSFEGKYEPLVNAFYVENRDNRSLERVLEGLMKKHEYAAGFDKEFLSRLTPSLLFLMRVSLRHVENERGRDEIALPEIEVLLKAIIDSAAELKDEDVYPGSIAHALFSLLEYYDVFKNPEKSLVIKCGLYILGLSEPAVKEVVESVCKMLIKACAGSEDDRVLAKALSTGAERTQMLFGEFLLKSLPAVKQRHPEIHAHIERKIEEMFLFGDPVARASATRALVLAAAEKEEPDECFARLRESLAAGTEGAFLGLVDLAVIFRNRRHIFEWVYEKIAENTAEDGDRAATKLLLSEIPNETEAAVLISRVVEKFYSENTKAEDAQYLHVFFHEYFRKRHWMVFSIYHQVIGKVKHWRVFNDQILYWFGCREDRAYTESDFLLLAISSAIRAFRESEELGQKERKELLARHLDILGKVAGLDYQLSPEKHKKALDLSSTLSKHVAKTLPDNEVVKNLLFDLVSHSTN